MATRHAVQLPRAPVIIGHVATEPAAGGRVSLEVDLIAILMGWPSLLAALLLAAAGSRLGRPALIWTGIVLTLPMALYLSGSPRFPLVGIAPVLALTVAALTCRAPNRWPAIAGVSAYAAFLAALAYIVAG